jgi:Phosphoribosyl-ATP pyrophosphohydrolase
MTKPGNAKAFVSPLDLVAEFYRRVGRPIRNRPTVDLPTAEVQQLVDLLNEETGELRGALLKSDLRKIADGLGDVVYVAYGAALQYGIDLDIVIDTVHAANMTKDDSGELAPGQKVPRGDSYVPPLWDDELRRMRFNFLDAP